MAKPTLIKPDTALVGLGKPAFSPAQFECIQKLEEALASAKNGDVLACVIVAVGPADFGIAIAGADAPRLNLGLDAAKSEILRRVVGK